MDIRHLPYSALFFDPCRFANAWLCAVHVCIFCACALVWQVHEHQHGGPAGGHHSATVSVTR